MTLYSLPWHTDGFDIVNAAGENIASFDDEGQAKFVALAASHHNDLVGALRYISHRADGCISAEDVRKWADVSLPCARMALARLSAKRPLLTENIALDSNVLDDLLAALRATTEHAEKTGATALAQRATQALARFEKDGC